MLATKKFHSDKRNLSPSRVMRSYVLHILVVYKLNLIHDPK